MRYLCYCIDGIRHGSGVSLIQALMRNLGTWRKIISSKGGVICSSDEMSESSWSEDITLTSLKYRPTRYGRSI